MKFAFSFLLTILATAALTHAAASAAGPTLQPYDRWAAVNLADHQVGFCRAEYLVHDGKLVTRSHTRFVIRRGDENTATSDTIVQERTRFEETADHKPLLAQCIDGSGKNLITTTIRFTPKDLTVTTRQAGQTRVHHFPPIKGAWLTPAQAQAFIKTKLALGTKQFSYRTIEPSAGIKPVRYDWTRVGSEKIHADGKTLATVKFDVQSSDVPGRTLHVWVDRTGFQTLLEMRMTPTLPMTIRWTTKQQALAKVAPRRVLASLAITPDQPIAQARFVTQAIYRVRIAGADKLDHSLLPSVGCQRVIWADARDATVVVDLHHPDSPVGDMPTKADRDASTMINRDDPKIQALVKQALGKEAGKLSDRARAWKLREFVNTYIDQTDYAVGYASASEVARTREGDCTEHAVLLAAMLRAAGIPSRIATGLVYAKVSVGKPAIFGYHMWTQAWLPGAPGDPAATGRRWVDLDATIQAPTRDAFTRRFDATHITLDVSSLADGKSAENVNAILSVMGRLSIHVVKTVRSGTTTSR